MRHQAQLGQVLFLVNCGLNSESRLINCAVYLQMDCEQLFALLVSEALATLNSKFDIQSTTGSFQ